VDQHRYFNINCVTQNYHTNVLADFCQWLQHIQI